MITLFLFVSCKTNQDPIPDVGLDYFPLKTGAYQIYSVDETQITQSIEKKFVYELKIQIVDSVVNLEGGYTYTMLRQKRNNTTLPWSDLDFLTARIDGRQAIVKEGNTSFVNLTFPVGNGLEWDGNAFNALGGEQSCGDNKDRPCDIYRMDNLGEEFAVASGMTFAETLTVIQNEDPDLIVKQDVRKEVYARDVGLIYKESVVLEYCAKSSCLGQQKVDKGLRFKQVLKEYGSN